MLGGGGVLVGWEPGLGADDEGCMADVFVFVDLRN